MTIGRLIGADDVCGEVLEHVTAWLPSVLAEIDPDLVVPERLDTLPTPESLKAEVDHAALVVTSPGLARPAVRDAEGGYTAAWNVYVAVFARREDYPETTAAVRKYAKAVRVSVIQHPGLGGFARDTEWVGETYDLLDDSAHRTIGGTVVQFVVTVDGVVEQSAAPLTPPPANDLITDPRPTVTSTHVEEVPHPGL